LIFLVMMHPTLVGRGQIGLDGGLVAGRMSLHFPASADTLVGLNMRARGHFLQENLDGFGAAGAFEGKDSGWFQHGEWGWGGEGAILSSAA
jgi:hypothetical protein